MDIGVLGGTFDPIHNGHLAVAEEVKVRLNLVEILFVPAGQSWLKPESLLTAAQHRVEMVRLALAGKPYFKPCTVEIERAGPSYTVETVRELKMQLGTGNELFVIVGYDSFAELPRWKEPLRLIRLCRLVVVPRPGYSLPDLNSLEAIIPGLSRSLIVLNKPKVDISATLIRERVAQGLSIRHLVPKSVDRYIRQHGLYAGTEPAKEV